MWGTWDSLLSLGDCENTTFRPIRRSMPAPPSRNSQVGGATVAGLGVVAGLCAPFEPEHAGRVAAESGGDLVVGATRHLQRRSERRGVLAHARYPRPVGAEDHLVGQSPQ